MSPELSIIIPTLNEESSLRETLDSLQDFDGVEIIVVDGGSADATVSIAQDYDVRLLHSTPNRGLQMQIGADAADGSFLWFLHADTVPNPNAVKQIIKFLRKPEIVGGNFTLRFDGESLPAKFMNRFYRQIRRLGLIYGDSAIFVRKSVYQRIGGFKPLPLFEDLDLIYRLKTEGKIITLPDAVTTSSRRFENRSFILTFLKWVIFQMLYWLGVSPDTLAKYYYPIRK